jgi:hypothetical protein
MGAMNLADRVEAIARSINKEFEVEYIYYPEVNASGRRYIDAADFLFAGQHESRLRIHVSGRDCSECEDDVELENLVRARIAAALHNALLA